MGNPHRLRVVTAVASAGFAQRGPWLVSSHSFPAGCGPRRVLPFGGRRGATLRELRSAGGALVVAVALLVRGAHLFTKLFEVPPCVPAGGSAVGRDQASVNPAIEGLPANAQGLRGLATADQPFHHLLTIPLESCRICQWRRF